MRVGCVVGALLEHHAGGIVQKEALSGRLCWPRRGVQVQYMYIHLGRYGWMGGWMDGWVTEI